jgi:hypothetical protein
MSYKPKIYISGEKPIDINKCPSYNTRQMIFNIGKVSIWIGKIPFKKPKYIPRTSYFDAGSYWKFSFYWLKFVIEFSGLKKDNTRYKEVTKEELDLILRDVK